MTLKSTANEVTLTAAGTANEQFSVAVRIDAEDELHAFEAGVLKTLNTDYTVSGTGSPSGVTVTWVGTPTAAADMRFVRIVKPTQATDYSESGAFPAETHERALDRLTMIAQHRLARDASSADGWDAENDPIKNVEDPTNSQDAATKAFVQAQTFLTSGNVPAPADPADDNKGYRASGGAVTLETVLVPTPVGGDALRALITTAAGVFAFHDIPRGNLLINGDGRVAQRGTSFTSATTPANSDDTWLLDRWLLLSDGNDRVDVSQEKSVVPTGAYSAIKLDTETVTAGPNAEKFGIVQILEARDSIPLQGKTVSLSFKARTTTGAVISNIRAGILAWTSTADSVTSDLVSAWNASGSNPTLATNWAFQNTPANIAVTADSYALHKIEGITMSSSVNNVAIFIWVDDTDHVAGDVVYITEVQLEIGDLAHDFQRVSFADTLAQCERYYQQSYDDGVAAGSVVGSGQQMIILADALTGGASDPVTSVAFRTQMRTSGATVTLYAPASGTSASIYDLTGAADVDASAINIGNTGFTIRSDDAGTIADKSEMRWHYTADDEL